MTTANTTIVRNTSGERRFFSFLGPRGAWLDSAEDIAVSGSLFDVWKHNVIQTTALKYALDNGKIEILETPHVYVYDETAERVYVLGADDDEPVLVDPDTGSYEGDPPEL